MKFKTNINCGGCVAAVTPVLNSISEISQWNVDTAGPDKILTVVADEKLTPETVIEKLKKAGYEAGHLS